MLKDLFRILLVGLLLLMLVGFGLCGLFGTVMGINELRYPTTSGGENFNGLFLTFGLIGLGIAGISALGLYLLKRKSTAPKH